jgi:hypothetical protein
MSSDPGPAFIPDHAIDPSDPEECQYGIEGSCALEAQP